MSIPVNVNVEKISIRKPNISLSTVAIYLLVIAAVSSFAFWRTRAEKPNNPQVQNALSATSIWGVKEDPFFSLSSSRTYGSNGSPRVWLSYRGVSSMDFRVYKVKDPSKFFKGLKDAHQIGEGEDPGPKSQPELLATINDTKNYFYDSIKSYVREQVSYGVRKRVNDALGRNKEFERRPLNVADYARVPLLNPDQMVTSWREQLPELNDDSDRKQVVLGKREPGVYLVEAVNGLQRAYTAVIVTDLAMVQKVSSEGDVIVQAVNRRTGAPQPNASVEVLRNKIALANGQTNTDGIFQSKVPKEKSSSTEAEAPQNQYLIMGRSGENFFISDLDSFYFAESESDSKLVGYIYTDRPVYRPEHKVNFKGILRNLDSKGYTLLQQKTVNVTVEDTEGSKIYEKDLPLSPHGTFKGTLDVPAKAKLGNYTITAHVGENTAQGYYEVDEYKKPEYKVYVKTEKPYVAVGDKAKFTIEAKYFFGAPVANAEVKYYVTRSRHYSYWWDEGDDSADYGIEGEEEDDGDDYYSGYGSDIIEEKEAKLDSQGKLTVEVDAKAPEKEDAEYDYEYRLEAEVTDASRRALTGSGSFVATRGALMADAFSTRWVYGVGQNALIQVRTSDYQGKPVSTRVTLEFNERRWEKVMKKDSQGYEYETWAPKDTTLSKAEVTTDARGMATHDYKTEKAGVIYIRTITYDKGKAIPSFGSTIYVTDNTDGWAANYMTYNYDAITLIPDKKSYQVGETAHVLALLQHDNASLLVTTEMYNVMSMRRMDVKGRSVMIDVPIESRFAPNFYLSVAYVKNNEFFTAEQRMVVPARDKMINLSIIPNKKEFRPRETASYTVLAQTVDGQPVPNAEVSMGVVDEAIYSIAGEQVGNIKADFYGRRWNRVSTEFASSFRVVGYAGRKPALLAENKKSNQLADFKNEEEQPLAEPTVRKDFKDTAFWTPDAVTGADGKAVIEVKLPDNLTTWRATARAVTSDTRVGSGTSKVIATKNLILRLETPRFVTAGDTVTLSGIVHNFLKTNKQTLISLQADGGQLLDTAQQRVNIASNGETRIDWRVTAPNQSGEITLLAKALTDTESDAIELKLKVSPKGLNQKQSQSVTTNQDGADQTVSLSIPSSSDENARTLRIEAAPSVASTLFGGLDYLTSYPYGCTEQTMSSFLPNVVVANALKNVPNARIKKDNKLNEKVQKGLDRLYLYQHDDGGWGWWKDDQTHPFMTAYVIDGLVQAKNAGYDIDQSRIDKARESLKVMLDRNDSTGQQWINLEIRTYMVYALNLSGKADASYTKSLFARKAELQAYGRALLALTLRHRKESIDAQTVVMDIERGAKVNNGAAYWTTEWKYGNGVREDFDIEATALSVKVLSNISPQSPLLPQAVRWLVQNRRYGYYWDSTRQTAFAIMGLIDYVKVSNELKPDYQLEVYLNGEPVINRRVSANDALTAQSFIIERKGSKAINMNQIRVVKRGAGSLYFTASYDYYADEKDAAPSQGMTITREYYRLKITQEATQPATTSANTNTASQINTKPKWTLEPLTGEVRSGDLIVSRIRVVGPASTYMMIEDPIPAGCEQVESVSGLNLNYTEGRWSDWYSSREFRDDKTVLFIYYFRGDATYQYAMRVQIPGDFKVIPARAELMYQPEIQAHTTTGFMRIMDKK